MPPLKKYTLDIPTNRFNKKENGRIVANWSGGVASAVACFIALENFDSIHLAFCNTQIEHPDTYRFKFDFERVLGVEIHTYQSETFNSPETVWRHFVGMNFAHGAPCSTELKRVVRVKQIQKLETDFAQIFGFTENEKKRAVNMSKNYPEINPVYPLIQNKITKRSVFTILNKLGIKPPKIYQNFNNNNCLGDDDSEIGGCVQGGIGYWKRMRNLFPKKFNYMAKIEHELTNRKNEPVTILRDQTKKRKGEPIFLLPHPKYPHLQDISVKKGTYKITTEECHGFCNTN